LTWNHGLMLGQCDAKPTGYLSSRRASRVTTHSPLTNYSNACLNIFADRSYQRCSSGKAGGWRLTPRDAQQQ